MKVSVIVPVFNAEKFLGACLESILNQTLQDFEVIAVDDCSTDNSIVVAENFLERFGGRLKIFSTEKNSGSGSVPRNEGLKFSRGEYIFFMDNDDLLVPAALETLYTLAENFRAEVVYMSCGFVSDGKTFAEAAWDKNISALDKPTFETENISERVENFLRTSYGWAPWEKFLRRDFLVANKINFPRVKISEDVLWTFKVVCLAKKFLRVPNRLYIWRTVKNSWSRTERTPQDEIKFWLDPLIEGLDWLDDFLSGFEFFAQNPVNRFEVTNFFVKMQIAGMLGAFEKLKPDELYEIVHRAFDGKHAALVANLFVFLDFYREKFLEVR